MCRAAETTFSTDCSANGRPGVAFVAADVGDHAALCSLASKLNFARQWHGEPFPHELTECGALLAYLGTQGLDEIVERFFFCMA